MSVVAISNMLELNAMFISKLMSIEISSLRCTVLRWTFDFLSSINIILTATMYFSVLYFTLYTLYC